MNAVQIYSNANNWFNTFVYVLSFTFICVVFGNIYLYVDGYIRNINNKLGFLSRIITSHSDKIKNSNKRIEYLEAQLKRLVEKYQLQGQYISGMSKEINGLNNKFDMIENEMHDLSIHNHMNISRLFTFDNNSDNDTKI